MKRYNAVEIQLHDDEWDNSDLLTLLYHTCNNDDIVIDNYTKRGDGLFWYDNGLPKELFKYASCFEWRFNFSGQSGSAKLWFN